MAFRQEKSLDVGSFRFTLSGSGLVISRRAAAWRSTPRAVGNYVRVAGAEIEYKKGVVSPPRWMRRRADDAESTPAAGPLAEIESADAARMVDSSSAELLEQLNRKRRRWPLWPFLALVGSLTVFALAAAGLDGWLLAAVAATAAYVVFNVYRRDRLLGSVVLLYDLDGGPKNAYADLLEKAQRLGRSRRLWHVEAEGEVRKARYHAGVDKLVRRKPTRVRLAVPPGLATNVEVVRIDVGRQKLYLLPDRALLCEAAGIGSVSYRDLAVRARSVDFAEEGKPAHDAEIVGRTWKHVNKDGSPDRRFGRNPQLQVCRYGEIHFQSESGLNELILASRVDHAESFAEALRNLVDSSAD